ncbi:lipid IV(A) 4-amino-4-deoxy-L-arabinosyltransferase [Rosenbergiella australiborealis]|uniref:Undecaprenyl phosphate-alpha-4-amino-4-deoxy-L-arabinose arabinosyl transferase n=1 Tax=Rosenbergiella australiborealis TaxID=1544696 RepID=A0ABS5T0J3_9GAMM|nr:lipid IV(A) 4-amino-4-deoxy-L-arabinosyltransferase [Rosenbergiella australiborealis]MBT0725872.1 lipid IV(A) 4-amino-4-deoxy-L-arabinosyltransferase [Rosenbergiella australiborealis]
MFVSRYRSSLIIIFALVIIYYFIPINGRLLWQPDETRYAEISREMLATGQWAVPHFLDIRYFEKPVMGYWINSIGQWLFGESHFAVRFGAIASTLLTTFLCAYFAWTLWRNRLIAYLTAVIHLSLFLVYGVGTYAVLDPIVSLWLVGAMVSFWFAHNAPCRRDKLFYYVCLGVCCGLGVMTKGFIALALPVVSIMPWLFITSRRREIIVYSFISMISCLLTLLPWSLIIARQEPDFWNYFFWVEHIQRFAQSNAQHNAPFWYYLPWLIAGSLPWLGLVPGALYQGWQDRQKTGGYLLAWALMPLLFFSLANGKLLTYILPCFAPLSLLIARYLYDSLEKKCSILRINAWINLIFASIMIIAIIIVSPWGPLNKPLWLLSEPSKPLLAMLAFAFWWLCAYLALNITQCYWQLIASCLIGIALTFGSVIPTKILLTKSPEFFLKPHLITLRTSQFVLSNDVGMAAGIAWQLQRSDVMMLNNHGELSYGLNYADAQHKYVSLAQFPEWLTQHRQTGTISLFLKLENTKTLPALPPADRYVQQGKVILIQYFPQ